YAHSIFTVFHKEFNRPWVSHCAPHFDSTSLYRSPPWIRGGADIARNNCSFAGHDQCRPGTAIYAGYKDDLNREGYKPFTGQFEPRFRRNGRTFFVKMSWLFRHAL